MAIILTVETVSFLAHMRYNRSMEKETELMTQGSVKAKIINFTLPLFFGNLFQQLYNAADSLIVGNFIGSDALAAVSTAGNLIFMMIGFFNGISIGAGVVIAHYIGAEDDENVERSVHVTVALGLVFSIIMTLVGVLFAPQILIWMSTPADVLPQSITYFQVYFAGSLGFIMYNTLVGILQAAGDSRHPLYYLVLSSLINVGLDLLLIGCFHMGVGAAAFATAASQLFSALLCLFRLMRSEQNYHLSLSHIRLEKNMAMRIIRFGFPSGLQNSIMSFSNVVIQSYINSYGQLAMAGIGAYVKVEGFIFIPITSFAMAITTFVSQNLGAGRNDRAREGIRFGGLCCLISAEVLGIIIFLFAEPAIRLFDSTPEVVSFGAARAHVVALFFFLCAFTHFMSSVLRGMGKPTLPMLVFLFCWCVMRVLILTITDHFVHTITTTYLVYPITWTLSSTVLLILYLRERRKI